MQYEMASGGIAQCRFLELVTIGMNKLAQQSLSVNGLWV
jgi:hypothetical protein